MLSCLLLVSRLHAASVAWYADPVVPDPHPVRYSYWARYHQLYLERATGPRSSALFREPMAASTVYYALWDATGQQPYLLDQTAERWRDMALSSASIAAEAVLWETIGRSEDLGVTVRLMRTFISPNLELKRSPDGWSARANDPDIRMRPHLERHEIQEGMVRREANATPTLSLGSGLDIQELDSLTDRERNVDAAAWLRLQHMGLDQLTVRGLVLNQTWELSGRQHVLRGVSAAAALSSRPRSSIPEDWGAGLTWTLPKNNWWTVALRYRRDIAVLEQDELEWNVRLMVRWLPPAPPPVIPGGWPLGQRVDAQGPVRPAEPAGQAVDAGPALPQPASTETEEPEDEEPRRRPGHPRANGASEVPR